MRRFSLRNSFTSERKYSYYNSKACFHDILPKTSIISLITWYKTLFYEISTSLASQISLKNQSSILKFMKNSHYYFIWKFFHVFQLIKEVFSGKLYVELQTYWLRHWSRSELELMILKECDKFSHRFEALGILFFFDSLQYYFYKLLKRNILIVTFITRKKLIIYRK
jgi:hypothetical protein